MGYLKTGLYFTYLKIKLIFRKLNAQEMKAYICKFGFLIIIPLILPACGGGGITTSVGGDGSVTLSWTIPTTYQDNTYLSPNEILGYRVYIGTDSNSLNNSFIIETGGLSDSYTVYYDTHAIENNTIYYLAMSTITTSGAEGALSEIVSFDSL